MALFNKFLKNVTLSTATALCFCSTNPSAVAQTTFNVHTTGAIGNGVADDTAAINAAVTEAVKSGPGTTVFLPKGIYRIATSPGAPKSIVVKGANGLTIEGEKGTVILVGSSSTAFDLSDSSHLTITHITVDHDPLEYAQGTVTAVDPIARTCDVSVEKGYPDLDAPPFSIGISFKPFIYPGADDYQQDHYIPAVDSVVKTGDHSWRLHFLMNGVIEDWTGKPYIATGTCSGWCFVGRNLNDWTVDDVAYWGGGGQAAWYLRNLNGTTTFRRFMVTVPPGSDRLYCCAGGGQISGLRGSLLIEDSKFERIDDDGLDVLASWSRVVAQPNARTLQVQGSGYAVGDHLSLWDWVNKESRSVAIVTIATDSPGGGQVLTLDRDVHAGTIGAGNGQAFGRDADADGIDRVIDLDTTGRQTIVRNCTYQDFRAKCLNLKAQNCTVEHCRFYDSWQPPVSACPEWYFEEGPPVTNLTVRDCTFTNCVHSNIEVGSVSREQMPPPQTTPYPADHPGIFNHETMNIVIEDNTFNGYGAHVSDNPFVPIGDAVRVLNAANVTITGNNFGTEAPTGPKSARLILIGCTNVKIENNKSIRSDEIEQH